MAMNDRGTEKDPLLRLARAADSYRRQPNLENVRHLQQLAGELDPAQIGWRDARIAILRTFTVENLLPYLEAALLAERIRPEFHLGAYGQLEQEVLPADGPLTEFRPDVVIIAASLHDLIPSLFWNATRGGGDWLRHECREAVTRLDALVAVLRQRTAATVVLFNFETPACLPGGLADVLNDASLLTVVQEANRELVRLVQRHRSVCLLDYERLVAKHGALGWPDPKLWYLSRNPVSGPHLPHLAAELAHVLRAVFGRSRKVLVMDCDGTLWGGIIGEDGLSGIALGDDFPGNAYKDFQRAILSLYDRGVILAVNSKNNPEDVAEVFQRHPEMIIKREHIASWQVNWGSKAENLVAIAQDLNVGLDSLVFVDDSPVEREMARQTLPTVLVVDLPPSPVTYARTLLELGVFDTLTVSDEDRQRGEQYRAQILRKELAHSTGSLEEYLRSLEMEAEVGLIDERQVGRVAQLTQKTNQFNLTVQRYSEQQVNEFRLSADTRVYFLRLRDRFGDNGLVGVAMVRAAGPRWEIDTFLQSCRVIGRTAEQALLAAICRDARTAGATALIGRFVRGKKNQQVQMFYRDQGFELLDQGEESSTWTLPVAEKMVAWPKWIRSQADREREG